MTTLNHAMLITLARPIAGALTLTVPLDGAFQIVERASGEVLGSGDHAAERQVTIAMGAWDARVLVVSPT